MKPIKPSEFTAEAVITLNGKQVKISGEGKIDQDAGSIFGKYKTKGIPTHVDKRIFKTVLVTGYPSVCADASDHISPFSSAIMHIREASTSVRMGI